MVLVKRGHGEKSLVDTRNGDDIGRGVGALIEFCCATPENCTLCRVGTQRISDILAKTGPERPLKSQKLHDGM